MKFKKGIILTISFFMASMIAVSSYAEAPVEVYENWDPELKNYTSQICSEYNVDYSLVLAVIYNESRFQSGLTHKNSNGTIDYGLMQVNEVNFDYLRKTIGIKSMEDLLDDKIGIQCGVELLAYHKDYTENDSSALLRYQIGAGNYKKYKQKGLYTNDTHRQVCDYRDTFSEYLSNEDQKDDESLKNVSIKENHFIDIINRWVKFPL